MEGLNPVEVFVPSTGHHCWLPDLPTRMNHLDHTMEELTVCGGWEPPTSSHCWTFQQGVWNMTSTLKHPRLVTGHMCMCNVSNGTHPAYPILLRGMHSSWASPSGTILMGGYDSPKTTEKLGTNGFTTDSFTLQYDAV